MQNEGYKDSLHCVSVKKNQTNVYIIFFGT